MTPSLLSGTILVTSSFPTCLDAQDAFNAKTACMAMHKPEVLKDSTVFRQYVLFS